MEAHCYICQKWRLDEFSCAILDDAICIDITDVDYPPEWILQDNNQPTCIAFLHKDADPEAPPRCPQTEDMFAASVAPHPNPLPKEEGTKVAE